MKRLIVLVILVLTTFYNVVELNQQKNRIDSLSNICIKNETKLIEPDFEKLQKSCVVIKGNNSFGSGSFITLDGLILTAGHVIDSEPNEIILFDSSKYKVISSWRSDKCDIGFIEIDINNNYCLEFSLIEPKVGDAVYCCGCPKFSVFYSTVVKGIISFVNRGKEKWIQTDLDIYGGNSGSPLVNKCGKIIGVMIRKFSGGTMNFSENLEHIQESLRDYYAG